MQQSHLNLPEFSTIKINTLEAQLDKILTDNRLQLQQLTKLPQINWVNFAIPVQTMDMLLEDFWAPISHLNGVQNSDALRDVYQRCIAKITAYSTELGQNSTFYNCYKKLQQSDEFATYSNAQKQWVDKALLDFHLSGVDLPADKQSRFKTIRARLAELTQDFSNNVLDATAAWQKQINGKDTLAGLPDSALAMLQQTATQKDLLGYLITLDFPIYHAVITYADNRALREELYIAYMTKASDQGPKAGEFDNSKLMVEILQLRQELAQLLDYHNYAERSLVTKMAESADQVLKFLHDLSTKSKSHAQEEVNTLQEYAKQKFSIDQLQAWDFAYISEKYKQDFYALSDEALREYFPLDKVLSGLFEITSRLFNIEIKQTDSFDSYHKDVLFYQIYQDNKLIAGFYLDLFARDKKRGGAWMADCRSRWLQADGTQQIPIAFLSCNFRPAENGKPALLSHTEVTTLFHEFGHGLHHMLTTETVAGISGIAGVEWDAVELPSQFMENWCWQSESIALISAHYQTGDALPDALLANMLAAKNFNAGIMMLRQLEFALFDMQLHCEKNIKHADQIQILLNQVRGKVAVLLPPTEVRFQHGFSHIFAGGYAAGYYSYKWAEVLSADAFSLFEETSLFDIKTGQRFLQNILQVGSSRSAAESFKAFRGQEPSTNALLKHSGLTT